MSRHHPPFRHQEKSPARPLASGPVQDLLQQAMTHHQAGRLAQAEALYQQILRISPHHPDALHLLGVMASQVGKYAIALQLIDEAIERNPQHATAYRNRGIVLQNLKRYQDAVASYDKAIQLKPNSPETWNCRAHAFYEWQHYQDALESYNQVLRLTPDSSDAWSNRGNVLFALRQDQAALESHNKAILFAPQNAQVHNNRATVLLSLKRFQEARESCNHALQLQPGFAEAFNNRGIACQKLLDPQQALENFEKAIQLKPDYGEAYYGRGAVLSSMERFPEALQDYEKAIQLCPGLLYAPGKRLHVKQHICVWEGITREIQELNLRIERGEKVASPFDYLVLSDSPALQGKVAETYLRDRSPAHASAPSLPVRPPREKIRIGYFSADFYQHATCYLMAELLERHNRERFEIFGFSFGKEINDKMTQRVSAAMDRFLKVHTLSDQAVAQQCRELQIDIAVDLKGFTFNSRPGIFAERAAPVQVSYLGYPGTMGADFMDYLVGDHTLIPEASQSYYREKIIYLPDSYQVNDSKRALSTKSFTRAEAGLPEHGFVYCSFNNNYKILPEIFDVWMRILRQVDGSVLWLLEDNATARENLCKEALRRGVADERLVFAKRMPLDEHLARHRLADLFLDTLPCNAHTTASDALWAGLPLLTCMGQAFAARVSASLLRAMDLSELITTTLTDYEKMAVELAQDGDRYREIRERLHGNRATKPLFDTARYARHLESAYTAIYERHQQGLPPEHIDIL